MLRYISIIILLSLSGCAHAVAINTGLTAAALSADTASKIISAATQLIEFGELLKEKTRTQDDVDVRKGEK